MSRSSSKKSGEEAPYRVLARRFRPQAFADLVGQDAIVKTLQTALEAGRIPHAYLFSGSRGVGKTTSARILSRALNCEVGPTATPCGECGACTSILAGTNSDVVEIDAASHNLVDDIRELRNRVGFVSMGSRYKIYILDEVHMLTRSAFNAFLKTLEEPPPNVVFIMATTELHKVPETIRSRCQVLLFRRIEDDDITRRLRVICEHEGVEMPDEVLRDISAACRGGMRDAETTLEQVLPVAQSMAGAFDLEAYRGLARRAGVDAVADVVEALLGGEAAPALRLVADISAAGADERELLGEIVDVLRALLLLDLDGEDSGLVDFGGATRARLVELSKTADRQRLDAMIHAGLLGRDRIRRLDDRQIVLELTLLRMAQAGNLPVLSELIEGLRSGAPMPVPARAPMPPTASAAAPAVDGAPAPMPASAPAPASAADLRARLIAVLQAKNPLLVRTVEQCRLDGPDDSGAVVISLESESRLHRDRLASTGVQEQLQSALRELIGESARVSIGGGGPRVAKPAGVSAKRRDPSAAVQRAVDKFDGEILENDGPTRD